MYVIRSCDTGMRALPDMYVQAKWCAVPKDDCRCIR